jgi:hypothetical protein
MGYRRCKISLVIIIFVDKAPKTVDKLCINSKYRQNLVDFVIPFPQPVYNMWINIYNHMYRIYITMDNLYI